MSLTTGGKEPEATVEEIPSDTKGRIGSFKEAVRQTTITLWIWELLSLLVSATCIGAITILLAHFDGKPIPTWSYGLTLNGIISILSGIAKSSLVLPVAEAISQLKWHWFWHHQRPIMDFERYDGASRGPWGSLIMLRNYRRWSLGSLGAAITIATLAVEPCLQQLPAYPSRTVNSGNALASRSVNYLDADNGKLGTSLKAAVFSGIFSGNTTSYAPDCATGNCTYPTHSTLGVCNACEDLSDLLYFNGATWGFSSNTSSGPFEDFDANHWLSQLYINSFAWDSMYPWYPLKFQGAKNHTVLDMILMYWSDNLYSSNPPPSSAVECILYFCVKEQQATTVNGVYTKTTLSTWPPPNETLPNNEPYSYDLDEVQNLGESGIKKLRNYTLTPPGSEETFVIDHFTLTTLRIWMENLVRGSAFSDGSDDENHAESSANVDVPQAFYDYLDKRKGGNKTVSGQIVQDDAGPSGLVEQIAQSMSNHMRQVADSAYDVTGNATSAETFVHARWGWAVFPMTLLFLTVGYMTLAVAVCAQSGMPVWKSSSLAVLLHGLDDRTAEAVSAVRIGEMGANASKRTMAVQRSTKPWKLESSNA